MIIFVFLHLVLDLIIMEKSSNISDRNRELLLEAIDNKRVIPIIGDDFFYLSDENGKEVSVRDYLIRHLAEKLLQRLQASKKENRCPNCYRLR